jgi:hypothetical protein
MFDALRHGIIRALIAYAIRTLMMVIGNLGASAIATTSAGVAWRIRICKRYSQPPISS